MIRIDEIYNNTLWPWLDQHRPGFRLFFYEPFGRSDPESLVNYGRDDIPEHNYILLHDQEPIHLNLHIPSFDEVVSCNRDIAPIINFEKSNQQFGYLCTSERDSDTVDFVCKEYGWKPLYYFFHGWAALDWYRGYDKTFLIKPYHQRSPKKTFIAPNRIIAGERQHRLEMLYWIFKLGLDHNHISCPERCPVENISVHDAAARLQNIYPDVGSVFASAQLPRQYTNESDHPMHSCWLSLFDESADSLLYLVTETVATGRRHHLTEKTFKPIALGMPFVMVSTVGSLKYLRSYGFKTFGHIWDESYDEIADDHQRIQAVAQLLQSLDQLNDQQRQEMFLAAQETVEHNWNHFYNGGFEKILWAELQEMLNGIEPRS